MLKKSIIYGIICLLGAAPAMTLSDAERAAVLKAHNTLRAQLVRGETRNADGRSMPTGRNVYEMSIDDGLERIAQSWADRCDFRHSDAAQRNNSGENLYFTTVQIESEKILMDAAEAWWKEIHNFGFNPTLRFTAKEFNKGIGHWSQMAWGPTNLVGCGVRRCVDRQFTIVVCNYLPAGNILNRYVYESGKPCDVNADCTIYADSICNTTTRLCSVIN